ncbi:uncharacterized protein EI97DRAFT_485377 [Westerdykella ornata]|uniref:Uncharacterized protein n=1 Tax=Westerdykella ornata TaxID=318751 RepID=A0A6A6J912_WESOR|nr:uncharacterized protein EI97DRAFT_485377 [Westerdykella ornata]KAF2272126.1 hypothetical protein EI97DRAFT_485377 [Westerdykella ornata]
MLFPHILLPLTLLSLARATEEDTVPQPITKRPDRGPEYDTVWIKNSCDYDVYAQFVGAWPRNANRNNEPFKIPAGGTYHEAYREVCPKPKEHAHMAPPPDCPELGKMEGESISIKISRTEQGRGPENILQLEYSLIQNPERGDGFPRLDYDVLLLNCNQTEDITEEMVAQDEGLNRVKIEGCPGYQKGLALWFDDHELCRPIYCDGETYCDGIYNYQRTGEGEDSFACHDEYFGDMYFEMCVGNGDGTALEKYREWVSTATSVSSLPEATATSKDSKPWTDQNPTHTSTADDGENTRGPNRSPTGSKPYTVDEATTSTTTLRSTLTLSYPRLTSPTPTGLPSKTYPVSCTYDSSASSEVCWSQLPPKTANTVTVTVTKTMTSVTTKVSTKTVLFTTCPPGPPGMSMSMSKLGSYSMRSGSYSLSMGTAATGDKRGIEGAGVMATATVTVTAR